MTSAGADRFGVYGDEPFDVAAVMAGVWVPGPYGSGDERGTYNEVTPLTTARALSMLDTSRPVKTYNLSETLFEGFPAVAGRRYQQTLCITGWPAPEGFEGIVSERNTPIGPWHICSLEERVSTTYNMGTKINGLHHVGVNGTFYNGYCLDDIARRYGTTKLGSESQGPIVTRGVLLDVLGYKLANRPADCQQPANGEHMLGDGYRITVEDIEACLAWEGVSEVTPGDVVLIRTGWRKLIALDPERYMSGTRPGPHLRECRYLAARRPAIIAMDSWKFGVHRDAFGEDMLPHQELPGKYGIRVGEAVPSDELAQDRVYEFVFSYSPQNALGAISGSCPPIALGQPRTGSRGCFTLARNERSKLESA